jgi:hypothetical protein
VICGFFSLNMRLDSIRGLQQGLVLPISSAMKRNEVKAWRVQQYESKQTENTDHWLFSRPNLRARQSSKIRLLRKWMAK